MKKYFLYELKKSRWQLIIITAICTLLSATVAAVMPMQSVYKYYNGQGELITRVTTNSPLILLLALMMNFMCFVAPALVYSFKMNKRSVDCYYALPLKKTKLYFVKTLIGLLIVFIPFTVAYWTTFFVYLIRPNNPYEMVWFVPIYFGLLFFGVCLYGYNAFAFTRANSVQDGVALMMGYSVVMLLIALVPFVLSEGKIFANGWYLLDFIPEWGPCFFTSKMETLVVGGEWEANEYGLNVMTFLMPLLRGAAGYALLFALLKYEKAEDSQQVCESWFGYKTLIPIFTATIIGLLVGALVELTWTVALVYFVMLAVASFVLAIVWRRKFVLGGEGWIVLGSGLAAAVVLALIVSAVL